MKTICAALLTTFLPLLAQAQAMPLHTTTGSDLGIQISGYRYEEIVNGSFYMSTEGNKVGITGSFTQTLDDDWYWGADARQNYGNVLYSSASTGSKGGNPDVITEIRITGGRDFRLGSQILSPYFGLGYRNLYNDLRGYTVVNGTTYYGYRRISDYAYVPLGITHRFRLSPSTRFATHLEFDYLLEGRQQSFLSDYKPTLTNPINTQSQGYGMRLLARWETHNWSVGVFYHQWNIATSDTVYAINTATQLPDSAVTEPANSTREAGVEWRLRFN